ncbi:MAG: Ig-like domain-containing protein [Deltaproteobacteria bacterium]|nr:Ig-like domain-containing protein [Deltaproteobacteria bacterium]
MNFKKYYLLYIIFLFVGCDSDENPLNNNVFNNNNVQVYNLEVVYPPAGEINIAAGETDVLELKLSDEKGNPVKEERIDFMIVGTAGGSSLGTTSGITDSQGSVSIVLRTGTMSAHFTITGEHTNAAPVSIDVTVSEEGSVDFHATIDYSGKYDLEEIDEIEVGVSFNSNCEKSLESMIISRKRYLDDFNGVAVFEDLPVDLPFVLLSLFRSSDDNLLAWGCVEPDPMTLVPGNTVDISIPTDDYEMLMTEPFPVTYTVYTGLYGEFLDEYLQDWFTVGECNYALAARFFDCLVSWLEGNPSDACERGEETPLSAEITHLRGTFNIDGCRGPYNSEGDISLEYIFQNMAEGIDDIQYSLIRTVDELNIKPFQIIELNSQLLYTDQMLSNNVESISFPRLDTDKWLIMQGYEETCRWSASVPVLTQNISIFGEYMKCNVLKTILSVISSWDFDGLGISMTGDSIKNLILEYVDEEYGGNPYEVMAEIFHENLVSDDIINAFQLFVDSLRLESIGITTGDLVYSGEFSFYDQDMDGNVESVDYSIDVDLYPQGF